MSDNTRDDDSMEILPVERRRTPRGPVPGLAAEVLQEPLAGQHLEVDDVGLESFFLVGHAALHCAPKQQYPVRLSLGEDMVECRVECIRCESEERTGAVMRLLPQQDEARQFLKTVLEPAEVPPGVD